MFSPRFYLRILDISSCVHVLITSFALISFEAVWHYGIDLFKYRVYNMYFWHDI